jgi:N6-L-threonylcarbamoyladenine synthase
MKILSIETSCDDTAVAIVQYDDGRITVLANVISSQIALHNKWGGVVPNLASREHIKNIIPVIEETLTRAALKPADIDLIAVTQGPGLMPALLIGVNAAKTLALVWQKPLIGVNHLEGHIYANFIGVNSKAQITNSKKIFPLIALIVSGGHTQLVLMKKHFDYTILGETQDDAAGETFDKVARLLGLPYPGGPEIAKRADAFRISQSLIPHPSSLIPIEFPRPMINSNDYNFSFSGLKTAVLYFLKKHEAEMQDKKFIDEVCYKFQEAVVDVLVAKSEKAIRQYQPETFTIAGGVSANVRLREILEKMIDNKIIFLTPEFSYSLDNSAMIGAAAALRYEHIDEKQRSALSSNTINLEPDANLPLASI